MHFKPPETTKETAGYLSVCWFSPYFSPSVGMQSSLQYHSLPPFYLVKYTWLRESDLLKVTQSGVMTRPLANWNGVGEQTH